MWLGIVRCSASVLDGIMGGVEAETFRRQQRGQSRSNTKLAKEQNPGRGPTFCLPDAGRLDSKLSWSPRPTWMVSRRPRLKQLLLKLLERGSRG